MKHWKSNHNPNPSLQKVRVSTAKNNTFLVKVADSQRCGTPRLTLAGHPHVCSASPRSTAKKGNHPGCWADRCCWARHTREGCCCHTQMHETINLSGLYESAWAGKKEKRGGGGAHAGVEVYTLGTAVSSWLASRSVFKPTPCAGIQVTSHVKKCECSGGLRAGGWGLVHCEAKKLSQSSDAAPSCSPPIKVNPG